ncbi:MAG: hypothetical protein PT944_05500 [Actinomycetaceae bacterium]|nr:hypothetical protein [Arcanobacterium sp.]MDD7687355.1 hypothetical protein [Actinomycetaceae bacterium]MDY5274124.1 hypothetical protein [Arcanobacterium sp.]
MSVALAGVKSRPWAQPSSRPVIDAPSLSVVPAPAPRRGFTLCVLTCAVLFIGALLLSFYLNTRMVQGAYEMEAIKVTLSTVQIEEETLAARAAEATSAQGLRSQATALGMVPATGLRHIDLDAGTVSTATK